MGDEGFEEWDADFLDQLIQVEELALSSTNPTQHLPQPPPPPSAELYDDISYSPPRELSQRVRDGNTKYLDQSFADSVPSDAPFHNSNEDEIERLKRELGRVSKQLTYLEQDCLQLRKERDKKEDQLKSVYSQIEPKDAVVRCRKSKNLDYGVHNHDHPVISLGFQNDNSSNNHGGFRDNLAPPTCKTIGVQTDKSGEFDHLCSKNDLSIRQGCQSKLLAVWDSPKGRGSPRHLVSKLFVACETDFQVLFGCLGLSSKASTTSLAVERSDMGLQDHRPPARSVEAAKVSHLYSMLTKIGTGMVKLEALFEALVDLCSVKNDVIVYRSLRVLHMVLIHTFDLEMESHKRYRCVWNRPMHAKSTLFYGLHMHLAVLDTSVFRSVNKSFCAYTFSMFVKYTVLRDNVIVEGPSSQNNTADTCEPKTESLFSMGANDISGSGLISFTTTLFNTESLWKEQRSPGSAVSTSCIDWGSVFELMHQIAVKNIQECVRAEAVAILNMILMRSNAYLDREKLARVLAFESISHLLRKESGLSVQKQAVHLLYLLLNCPKVMAIFFSCSKEECGGATNIDVKNASSFQAFSVILDGLADCVACGGNGTQELKLRRSVVTLLAFLASSGKPGFEILLGKRLPQMTSFLALILQMLVTEMDVEVVNSSEPPENFQERTLLIRETLILLNRLVSNPQYSAPVLRILMNSRDMACLTVDIANRLSCKGKWLWQPDSTTRQLREYEIVDLARVFKKRIFTFIGDNMS